jgi:hypothetical protein
VPPGDRRRRVRSQRDGRHGDERRRERHGERRRARGGQERVGAHVSAVVEQHRADGALDHDEARALGPHVAAGVRQVEQQHLTGGELGAPVEQPVRQPAQAGGAVGVGSSAVDLLHARAAAAGHRWRAGHDDRTFRGRRGRRHADQPGGHSAQHRVVEPTQPRRSRAHERRAPPEL